MNKTLTTLILLTVLFILGICLGYYIAEKRLTRKPEYVNHFNIDSLINKIRSDSITIATLRLQKDSVNTIYITKKESVKTHLNSPKTSDQITTYLNDVLKDSQAVYFADSNYIIKGLHGNAVYNAFYSSGAYKELNELCEYQLELGDSMLVIALNDIDSLRAGIINAKSINEDLLFRNEQLERKIDRKNKVIGILSGVVVGSVLLNVILICL